MEMTCCAMFPNPELDIHWMYWIDPTQPLGWIGLTLISNPSNPLTSLTHSIAVIHCCPPEITFQIDFSRTLMTDFLRPQTPTHPCCRCDSRCICALHTAQSLPRTTSSRFSRLIALCLAPSILRVQTPCITKEVERGSERASFCL